jgi:hypothetical protein
MSRNRNLRNGTVPTATETLESDRIVNPPTNGEATKVPNTVVTPVLVALAPVSDTLTCLDRISQSITRLYRSSLEVAARMSHLSHWRVFRTLLHRNVWACEELLIINHRIGELSTSPAQHILDHISQAPPSLFYRCCLSHYNHYHRFFRFQKRIVYLN